MNIFTLKTSDYVPIYAVDRQRCIQMNIRISPEEKHAYTKAANLCGMSLAAWVRFSLRISANDAFRVGETNDEG